MRLSPSRTSKIVILCFMMTSAAAVAQMEGEVAVERERTALQCSDLEAYLEAQSLPELYERTAAEQQERDEMVLSIISKGAPSERSVIDMENCLAGTIVMLLQERHSFDLSTAEGKRNHEHYTKLLVSVESFSQLISLPDESWGRVTSSVLSAFPEALSQDDWNTLINLSNGYESADQVLRYSGTVTGFEDHLDCAEYLASKVLTSDAVKLRAYELTIPDLPLSPPSERWSIRELRALGIACRTGVIDRNEIASNLRTQLSFAAGLTPEVVESVSLTLSQNRLQHSQQELADLKSFARYLRYLQEVTIPEGQAVYQTFPEYLAAIGNHALNPADWEGVPHDGPA